MARVPGEVAQRAMLIPQPQEAAASWDMGHAHAKIHKTSVCHDVILQKEQGQQCLTAHCRPCQALIAIAALSVWLQLWLRLCSVSSSILKSYQSYHLRPSFYDVRSKEKLIAQLVLWSQILGALLSETSTNLKWLPSIPGVLVDAVVCRLHMAQKAWTMQENTAASASKLGHITNSSTYLCVSIHPCIFIHLVIIYSGGWWGRWRCEPDLSYIYIFILYRIIQNRITHPFLDDSLLYVYI